MKNIITSLSIAIVTVLVGQNPANAAQPKGYMSGNMGQKCWYEQQAVQGKYLIDIPGKYYVLRFLDSKCMTSVGLEGDINKMIINRTIGKVHSHDDADFGVRKSELFRTSVGQVRGQCMKSGKYPNIAVAVEYMESGGYLTGVTHSIALPPCKN